MIHRDPRPIAFCGTRGLPARYGGFETAVDEITRRLVDMRVPCEVFCRRSPGASDPAEDSGRNLRYISGSNVRALDTFVSSISTGLHILRNRKRYSHAFWFNNANLPGIFLTRIAGVPFTVNTDGLEWRRAKWSWPFKLYYFVASLVIARVSRRLISDSRGIQEFYRSRFGGESFLIPYGAPVARELSPQEIEQSLRSYDLNISKYFLQITRLEPDNLPLTIAEGFVRAGLSKQGYKLLIVGYQHDSHYSRKLKRLDGVGGVHVAHACYDQKTLAALRQGAFCYVHGNSVGGTNPALLEAMASCRRVLAIDSVFSHEVLGETGSYFDPAHIAERLRDVLDTPDMRTRLGQRVGALYSWGFVAEAYLQIARGYIPNYAESLKKVPPENQPELLAME